MGYALKRHDVDKQKGVDGSDFGPRIQTRLLKAFGKVNKANATAVKLQDGKSIVVGGSKAKKDVWDF
ncbi:MAG: hypothetical protein JWQ23_1973 [Herminiimonas sp.]|jgi:hypothetical protein|nr:hypothetical protein [Herminiimonas sp.]